MSHAMYYPRHQSAMNRFMNIFSSSRRVHNVKVINSSCWLLLPCCWLRYADANINKYVLLRGTVHRHRADRPSDSPAATDSPRDAWWTVSCSYTFWFLSRDVKNTKYNQYFPVFWRRLTCPTQDFGNSYCFEHDVIMSGHCDITVVGLDTIVCSYLQLATSTTELTLLTTWFDCGKRVIRKIPNAVSRASYGP